MITGKEAKEILTGSFQFDILDSILSIRSLEDDNKSFDIDLAKIPDEILEKIMA